MITGTQHIKPNISPASSTALHNLHLHYLIQPCSSYRQHILLLDTHFLCFSTLSNMQYQNGHYYLLWMVQVVTLIRHHSTTLLVIVMTL